MEKVNCNLCHSREHEFFFSDNDLSIVRCLSCGMLFVNPQPDSKERDIAISYGHKEYNIPDDIIYKNHNEKLIYGRELVKYVETEVPNRGKWLDIGCATGFLLQAAEEKSWETTGLELNIKRLELARKHVKGPVYDIPVEKMNKDTRFDVISMLNVFSHLVSPMETLKRVVELLADDGHFLLQTGNFGDAKIPKDGSHSWNVPDHLWFCKSENIFSYLEKLGLQEVKSRFLSMPEVITERHHLLSPSPKKCKTILKKMAYYVGYKGRVVRWILAKTIYRGNPCGSWLILAKKKV